MNAANEKNGKDKKNQVNYARRGKNPTTNFPRDSHKEFCMRCLKKHHGCPVEGEHKCDL